MIRIIIAVLENKVSNGYGVLHPRGIELIGVTTVAQAYAVALD